MKGMLIVSLVCGCTLAGCGNHESPPPAPEEKAQTEQRPAVPENNVFHDQVEALNKAKDVEKLQEERKQQLDRALEEQEGGGEPPRR